MALPSQKKISHPSPLCLELLVLVLAPQIEVGDIHKQGFGFDADWQSWEHSDWEMVESFENRCQKKTQHHTNPVYLDAISQGCVPELDHDQSISQGPNGGPCSQRAAPLDSILCCSWETC